MFQFNKMRRVWRPLLISGDISKGLPHLNLGIIIIHIFIQIYLLFEDQCAVVSAVL